MEIQVQNHSLLVSQENDSENDSLIFVYIEKVFYVLVRDILSIILQVVVTNHRQIHFVSQLFLVVLV